MEPKEHLEQEGMVRLTIELPVSTVAWLDELKTQMGFRSRGVVVGELLGELSREADVVDEEVA